METINAGAANTEAQTVGTEAKPIGGKTKRNFSGITLKEVMLLLRQTDFQPWKMEILSRPPSAFLTEALTRFESFDTENTEAAKLLLIDALFAEVVPQYPNLKVWKAMPLESDTLTGTADYLLAPKRAYLSTPLLCVAEAKRDDFVQGRAQCLAEMVACQWNNRQEGLEIPVFGIVSNGQTWQFYKLTQIGEVYATEQYSLNDLPELLGALDYVCAECVVSLSNTLPV